MLNKKPIFIVGFSRGGSNIMLNLLRSHPHACSPRGETNEVFRGKGKSEPLAIRWEKWRAYLPILLEQKEDVFSADKWELRRPFSETVQMQVDRFMFEDKRKARDGSQNKWRTENVEYTDAEIDEARLLCKNLDGIIFLTPEFARMYPDAHFIGLVRNGYAVCEGHFRRKSSLTAIARKYRLGAEQMLKDAETLPNFNIIRYEDIIEKPLEALADIYRFAGLDPNATPKIRLQTKQTIQADGKHRYVKNAVRKVLVWYEPDEFMAHFVKDANQNQINRLTPAQLDQIEDECGDVLAAFGYTRNS